MEKEVKFLAIGNSEKFKKDPTDIARTLRTNDSCGGASWKELK